MQTFLPYRDFVETATVLDDKRLGKQIIEAGQIVRAILDPDYGWQNHPAVSMWRGYVPILLAYTRILVGEWQSRRGKMHGAWPNLMIWLDENNELPMKAITKSGRARYPDWLGDEDFHASHRSNLLRKDPDHYGKFGWEESSDLDYVWPSNSSLQA